MNLLTSGKLNDYLVDIENQAENMFFQIVKQLAESDNITEELKAKDQMEWVAQMNNVCNRAREIVNLNLQGESITNIYNENTGKQSDNAYYIGKDYVIKSFANYGSIKNAIGITNSLAESALPVAEIVKTVSGDDYIQNGELYFIVTKRIQGRQLKCENIFANTDLAFRIGKNIVKLHNAIKDFDESNFNYVNILNDVKSNFPKVKNFTNIDNFTDEFAAVYDK